MPNSSQKRTYLWRSALADMVLAPCSTRPRTSVHLTITPRRHVSPSLGQLPETTRPGVTAATLWCSIQRVPNWRSTREVTHWPAATRAIVSAGTARRGGLRRTCTLTRSGRATGTTSTSQSHSTSQSSRAQMAVSVAKSKSSTSRTSEQDEWCSEQTLRYWSEPEVGIEHYCVVD